MKPKPTLLALLFFLCFSQLSADDPMIGEIRMFAGNFAPRGWAFCEGQLLPISQHSALFSILGTTYGGDGRTTFALPDLRGRAPVHPNAEAGRLGAKKTGTHVERAARDEANPTTQSTLRINYIICVKGSFPSRN